MRLFSTVLLSVGTAVIIGMLGKLSFVFPIPPLFLAFLVPCAFFFGIRFARYEEDIVLLPFAAAGALFSFGSGATVGVGVLMLMFALIGFANAKSNGTISSLRALPVWLAMSAVCVLAPYSLLRLPSIIVSEACGLIAFFAGALLFHLHLKAEKKKKADEDNK